MKTLSAASFITIFFLFFCCIILGCKKDKKTTTYDFTYSGSLLVGDTIYFTSTAPSGSTYAWNFGDTTTSITSAPYHVYDHSDSFTVNLIITNSGTTHSITKTIFINAQPTYDFSYSGTLIIGDTVYFISTAPSGSTYTWNFGDTTSSTASAPYHVYNHSGSFTVNLIISAGGTTHSITKTIFIYVDPIYTHLIAGVRSWHHNYTLYRSSYPPDTINYPDTSFAVNYINPITIAIGSDTLTYSSSSGDSILNFNHTYYIDGIHPTGRYDSVLFNYIRNTVFFEKYDRIGAGGYSIEDYTTP